MFDEMRANFISYIRSSMEFLKQKKDLLKIFSGLNEWQFKDFFSFCERQQIRFNQ